MKRAAILIFITLGFSSTSFNNKAESIVKIERDTLIHIDSVAIKTQKLDSLLNIIKKQSNEKRN